MLVAHYASVVPADFLGREHRLIRFEYNPVGHRPEGHQGPNEGSHYSGTLEELKQTNTGYLALINIADGRGIRAFRIDRMAHVDILS